MVKNDSGCTIGKEKESGEDKWRCENIIEWLND
jgi:hypothetical protein